MVGAFEADWNLSNSFFQSAITNATFGYDKQLVTDYGLLKVMSVGYNICCSWVGLAATMVISLETGGSVTLLYSMIIVLFALSCSAATMAELASVYPTAGGPYHWSSILAPKKYHRVLVRPTGASRYLYTYLLLRVLMSSQSYT